MVTISSAENKPAKNYIAFFDLDRTLIAENSGAAMVRQAYKKGMMGRSDLIKAIYLSILYRLNLKDTIKIIDDMVAWVAGLPEKAILELSAEVAENILIPSIHSEVQAELNYHREKNAKVVILSSALKPVCLGIADYLGMDDVLCSDLEVVNGHYTGLPKGRLCFGEEKASRLKDYCEINNTTEEESWCYGDSVADIPVLRSVGHPICINPDKKLNKFALGKGWKAYQWH